MDPEIEVSGMMEVCKGDKHVYTASGGGIYAWSANAGSATIATVSLSLSQTTAYTASATLNGCTFSKTFTVVVNACVGIEAQNVNSAVRIYPNPVNEELNLELKETSSGTKYNVRINNNMGQTVYEKEVVLTGKELTIKTEDLPNGVYILNLKTSTQPFGVCRRFVVNR